MATFVCLLNWTERGVREAKDAGKRHQAARILAEKLGGHLVSSYVTTGRYDVILTLEMPDGEAIVKFAVAIGQSGIARTTTLRAFPTDQFAKLAADAPSFF